MKKYESGLKSRASSEEVLVRYLLRISLVGKRRLRRTMEGVKGKIGEEKKKKQETRRTRQHDCTTARLLI